MEILASQPWVERLGWTLVHFIWQGAAIAVLYAAVRAGLMGGRSSNARYLLACGALVLMISSPIATWHWLRPATSVAAAVDRTARIPAYSSIPPMLLAPVQVTSPRQQPADLLPWVVAIWMMGATGLWLRFLGGWMAVGLRVRKVNRGPADWQQRLDGLRLQLGVWRPVRLAVSEWMEAPAVIGWLRPVVLVPAGALSGLPAEYLEALLIHELAHIRRHDYLVNLMQSTAEALLFYHPAVWWVSGHIRAEREACCDDIAVRQSGDVLTYACALAELESQRLAGWQATVAANGASLAERVARLVGERRPSRRSGAGGGVAIAAALLLAGYGLFGQAEAQPSFQVASIKRNTEAEPRGMMVRVLPGGHLSTMNATPVLLIQNAYRIQGYQIAGGSEWLNTDGYDIEAKPEGPADETKTWLMLRSLLTDRFKLAAHSETRELPVWALTVAKGGPRLPAPEDPGCVPGGPVSRDQSPCGVVRVAMSGGGLALLGKSVPIGELVKRLADVLGQPVIDRTGFTGLTDIRVAGFTPDENTMGLPGSGGPRAYNQVRPVPVDPTHPNIMAAVEEQVGLKLVRSRGPVEVLVIDHVERPAAN